MDLLRNITLFVYTVIVNLVLRIAMYTVCGVIMRGYIDRYIIDPAQRGGLALGGPRLSVDPLPIEECGCLRSKYTLVDVEWETNETNKYLPKHFTNL